VVVALSGGGDSLALLDLARTLDKPILAGVIDHSLRPGAAADAAFAVEAAAALGATPVLRRLTGLKASQTAARAARYAALCEIARAAGAGVILLGHTQDDQAETVLMRAARGSGPRGLAGMAGLSWCPQWPAGAGLALARPLLGVAREDLRAHLRARNLAWREDPANADPRFDRARARAALSPDPAARRRLAALAQRFRPIVEAEAAQAWRAAQTLVVAADDGALRLPRAAWAALADGPRRRLLAALILAASGAPRAPPPAALARLDRALAAPAFTAATLGGARLSVAGAGLLFTRDPGAALGHSGRPAMPPVPLENGAPAIIDARFRVTARTSGLCARLSQANPGALEIIDAAGQPAAAAADVASLAPQRLREILTRPQAAPCPPTATLADTVTGV
jgi:tRNA(Ile)-lysidine synthase